MDPDGTKVREVTPAVTGGSPAWSPDGMRIAFTQVHDDIWVVRADGSAPAVQLSAPGLVFTVNWYPVNLLVFNSNRDGNYEVYTMQADGTQVVRVTNTPDDEFEPAWYSPSLPGIAPP